MPPDVTRILQIIKEQLARRRPGCKTALHPGRTGRAGYLPAWAMTFSKTLKKLPPQIFAISRSV